jgi:hypothetical protein
MVCTDDAECTSDKKCYADFPTDLPVHCPPADMPVIKLCKTQP